MTAGYLSVAPELGGDIFFGSLEPYYAREINALLTSVEVRRHAVTDTLDPERRVRLSQYFTPHQAARLIASMVALPDHGMLRVLDPGAGVGSLTAALVARIITERPNLKIAICAVEQDSSLLSQLSKTLGDCDAVARALGTTVTTEVVPGDLVELATDWQRKFFNRFDTVIMNPPYRKLAATSVERRALAALGVSSPNLYSAFLALGSLALVPGGQLVAITPRSFANGSYFENFRRFFLGEMSLDRLHVFESRATVFADSNVLQENIILSAKQGASRCQVQISTSRGHLDNATFGQVPYEEIVRPHDRHRFIRIPTGKGDIEVAATMAALPCSLAEIGIRVSTGKVVDFRARDHLREEAGDNSAPLVYPGNLQRGRVEWPLSIRKPQALDTNERTQRLFMPNERFVLTKRFSAKEERRRVMAAVCAPERLPGTRVAFENHLNVFHDDGRGLERNVAVGLCLWLNSSILDRYFRTFSGHTQVNATDLRSLRFPSLEQLAHLGKHCGDTLPSQMEIDRLVSQHVLGTPT